VVCTGSEAYRLEMTMSGELVTAEEMANRIGLQPSTIRIWGRQGFIPVIRITGKVIRYDPDAVLLALRKRGDLNQYSTVADHGEPANGPSRNEECDE